MADKLTPEQRHHNMAAIRSKNTRPEVLVRKFLHAHGYRFRLHERRLPGTPDIVMRKLRTVILVNGCFWHGHGVTQLEGPDLLSSDCCKIPKSNHTFWVQKISRNRERDNEERKALTALGWNVIQIWECELKPAVRLQTLQSLLFTLSEIELSLHPHKPAVPYRFDEEPLTLQVADDDDLA